MPGTKTLCLVTRRNLPTPLGGIQESPFLKDVWAEINGFQEIQGVDFGSKLELYRSSTTPDRGHGRGRGWINPSPGKASISIRINLGNLGNWILGKECLVLVKFGACALDHVSP